MLFLQLNMVAQQQSNFTLFNRNALYHNPGFTGMEGGLNVGTTYREQWTDFDNAPNVVGLNAHTKIGGKETYKIDHPYSLRIDDVSKYKKLGLDSTYKKYTNHAIGGYVIYDDYAPFKDLEFAATYAYHLPVSSKLTWSLGISVGGTNSRFDADQISVINDLDPTYIAYRNAGNANELYFDMGFGTVLYGKKFYVSYGGDQLLPTDRFEGEVGGDGSQVNTHHQLSGGYVLDISNTVELYPSALLMYVDDAPVSANFLVKTRVRNMFIAGVGYERSEALSAMLGLNLNNILSLAYAYSYPVRDLASTNDGTHSINLNIAFNNWANSPAMFMW